MRLEIFAIYTMHLKSLIFGVVFRYKQVNLKFIERKFFKLKFKSRVN
jgi:hypothetical protein